MPKRTPSETVSRRRPVPVLLAISELGEIAGPRLGGLVAEHVKLLAEGPSEFPPIVVDAETRNIIDGRHRVAAARQRDEDTIWAIEFHGNAAEAFALAVDKNTKHGHPLTYRDRIAAANRLLQYFPYWSDRALSNVTGLSTRTVAHLRHSESKAPLEATRIGIDGRSRPVSHIPGRQRAARIIRSQPRASLRLIAQEARISVSTAHDVRERLRRGEDPIPTRGAPVRNDAEKSVESRCPSTDLPLLVQNLSRDPSLRFNQVGRLLIYALRANVAFLNQWPALMQTIPDHQVDALTVAFEECSILWKSCASTITQRAQPVPQDLDPQVSSMLDADTV